MMEIIKSENIDCLLTGTTAVENRQRMFVAKQYGDCYFSKTWGTRRVHPILWWTEDEVRQYIRDLNLPLNPMYLPPYNRERCGCMPCTAYKQWEKELKTCNPKMYSLIKLKKDNQYTMTEVFK